MPDFNPLELIELRLNHPLSPPESEKYGRYGLVHQNEIKCIFHAELFLLYIFCARSSK